MDKYFLVQIKRTNGTIEKGIAVKDSLEDAEQGFHAYLRRSEVRLIGGNSYGK